jgi:hypothetical protein
VLVGLVEFPVMFDDFFRFHTEILLKGAERIKHHFSGSSGLAFGGGGPARGFQGSWQGTSLLVGHLPGAISSSVRAIFVESAIKANSHSRNAAIFTRSSPE